MACGALYCSSECEEASWQLHHCLLCTARDVVGFESQEGNAMASPELKKPLKVDPQALHHFVQHASESNEIFLLVAKVLAMVSLRAYSKLTSSDVVNLSAHCLSPVSDKQSSLAVLKSDHILLRCVLPAALLAAEAAWERWATSRSSEPEVDKDVPGGESCEDTHPAVKDGVPDEESLQQATKAAAIGHDAGPLSSANEIAACGRDAWQALSAAWLPFTFGWKKAWWDSVAVPDDVDDEETFRWQLRSLVQSSLALLRKALPGASALFPPLFSEEVFGAIVGMFELNNLSLSVPTPVEDYLLMIDDLPENLKSEAQVMTQPLLDALDKSYDEPCEGTAFYALQSCANHSCDPVALTEGNASGHMSLLALTDIRPGQEITISYIDESLGYKDRQKVLKDYGFKCDCDKCVKDREKHDYKKRKGAKRAKSTSIHEL
ncbi:hypothetical protein CEUSTIGMA_g6089.t1 [Chlamydomonas eustigma]|uniref:SET domain-containing protein n=1 Tax=Chlamydomonas eustigma TaxID=1157962 RepID=A0A250X6E6_9CHLO|nr:hypothetical protein CEUSTIGMA_g6089.t1 [Chlamydomonas eustigma]|eukprot:GAX78651.1 hypothetical protein CEUSTIGMA_g6089.t1 [Chlamydomonas eustigma]